MVIYRTAIPLSMTVLISPEVQVMLGNGMGMVGWLFPLCLVLVAALHLLTLQAYNDIYGGRYQIGGEYAFLSATFGTWLPLVTSLASRGLFMVCAATIVLVTAGFVFNEVFVYWFANFAFAFLLLAFVLISQLAGRRWALKLQIFLVFMVMAMVAILVAAGLSQFSALSPVGEIHFNWRGLFLPFLMVIGVEFVFLNNDHGQDGLPRLSQVAKVFLGVILLLSLWGLVMAQFVEPARLAGSFNPQMIAAHQVLGQPGRLLMGAVLIGGAVALVNGLLLVLHRQLAELVPAPWVTENFGKKKILSSLGVVALIGAPAIMMVTGMAGEEMIDVYARVALVFWIFHYSLVHFSVHFSGVVRKGSHLLAGIILIGAAVALVLTDPEPVVFLKSIAMIVLVVGAISLIITQVKKNLIQGG